MIIFNNSVPVVIAATNMGYYRNYFITCEYLQIDPKKEYELDYINQRIEHVLSCWSEADEGYKKLTKELKIFKIDEQTISETYVKKPLTKINHKAYIKYSNMLALKVLGIILIVVLAFITAIISQS